MVGVHGKSPRQERIDNEFNAVAVFEIPPSNNLMNVVYFRSEYTGFPEAITLQYRDCVRAAAWDSGSHRLMVQRTRNHGSPLSACSNRPSVFHHRRRPLSERPSTLFVPFAAGCLPFTGRISDPIGRRPL